VAALPGPSNAVSVTFQGTLGGTAQPSMVLDPTNLTVSSGAVTAVAAEYLTIVADPTTRKKFRLQQLL